MCAAAATAATTAAGIFEHLGYGEISDDDLAVLFQCADTDRDGKISLDDFRGMLNLGGGSKPTEEPAAVAEAAASGAQQAAAPAATIPQE